MEFEIELDYTIEDFAFFWYNFVRKKAGKPLSRSDDPPRWAMALGRFFSWFFIGMGIVSIVNSLVQGRGMYMEGMGLFWNLFFITPLGGIVEIAFGVLVLRRLKMAPATYLLRPPYAGWVRSAWKKYQAGDTAGTCRFTEDGCWFHGSKSDFRCDYDFLEKLWEDEGHYYLELPEKPWRMYMLPKRGFTVGEPEDFPAFWEKRTRRRVLEATPERKPIRKTNSISS